MTDAMRPNDQADPQPERHPTNETKTAQTPDDAKTETLTAVGSSALFGVMDGEQKTISSPSPTQITLENATINTWRERFPKLSDLLRHVERYPNVWWVLERMRLHRLRPLLDQWQKDGHPDIEWLEPSEYQ